MIHSATYANQPIHVVAVENRDEWNCEIMRLLRGHPAFHVRIARNWRELEAVLGHYDTDVVVIHAGPGSEPTFEINERIKAFASNRPATVFYGGENSVRITRKAFRCGFSEFLPQDSLDADHLMAAVRHAAGIAKANREVADLIEFLETSARWDSLTGLPNQIQLHERVAQLAAQADRFGTSFSVIVIQIDNLADIRRDLGLRAAEKAMRSCAAAFKRHARTSDHFGSLGDGTFYYLIDRQLARRDFDELRRRLTEGLSVSVELENVQTRISVSSGFAVAPEDGITVDALLEASRRSLNTAVTVPPDDASSAKSVESAFQLSRPMSQPASMEPAPNAIPAAAGDGGIFGKILGDNRRNAARHRVLKRGRIIFNGGNSTANCVVKDLSSGGARITMDSIMELPGPIELLFVESGTRFKAQKRWEANGQIGLAFVN